MGPRLSVLAGLVAGVLVAVAVLAGVILAVPATLPPSAPPSAVASAAVSVSPSASPSVGPSPSVAAPASASARPSGSPGSSAPGGPSGSAETTNFHIGQPAPILVVPQLGGGTIDLSSLKGKAVWVNFMQTTCPPCIDEFPIMNGFAARYADDGLVVIAIDIREDESAVTAFAQQLKAGFPLGLDADGAAQKAWGAYGLPVHFWIDKSGTVRDGALGGIGPT
jgi:cytochrome c biogenesis protein CcmG/thiol:disulfide interchange protein DsbE